MRCGSARIARLLEVPVWGTEENPSKLGENLPDIRALCQRTLAKMHFSAAEEGLGEWLRAPAQGAAGQCAQPAQASAEGRPRPRAQHAS